MDVTIDQKYACIYMLDIIHHLPREFVPEFIQNLVNVLEEGGRLIIKDVDTFPYPKMVFTWLLDRIMSPQDIVHYWPSAEFIDLLESNQLTVYRHSINDILPYSHVLYVCHKK
jgi:hypothetical protein